MPVIPALGRQEDGKFEANLGYIVRLCRKKRKEEGKEGREGRRERKEKEREREKKYLGQIVLVHSYKLLCRDYCVQGLLCAECGKKEPMCP
jgi:hypothetical protein